MMKKKNEKNNNEKNKDNPNFQYNILKIEKLEENLEEEEDQIFLVYRGEKIETKKSLLFTKCRYFRKHIELFHQKEIDVSDKYSSETFRNFISSMKSQELEIHENTIFEYFELSSRYEYHELYFSLEKYLHSVPFLSHIAKDLISIDSISNSTKSSKSNKSISEDIISNNFDENDKGNFEEDLNEKKEEIIAKHFEESYRSGLLRKMKYSRLYRILSSPSLFISNHHHLFEFIISLFDDFIKHDNAKKGKANHINFDKDKEKSILQTFSTFLNYEEMNESEINKLISHPLFCDCFQPKYSTTIISRLLEQQQSQLILQSQQETLFHELEKKYESQLTRFEEMKNQIYKELDTKFSEQHQQINEILTRNEQQTQEIESKFSTLEQSFFDHKTEIRKDIDTRIKSKITENSTLMKKEYFDSLRQEIDFIKQQLNLLPFESRYENQPFEGIISKLTQRTGRNVYESGIVDITGNKYKERSFSSLFDYNYTGESYYSINKKNSYVCFDFKSHQISLTNYSIKTSNNHLRSWKIEGSNDGTEWKELDSHSNDQTFCSRGQIHTFEIKDGNFWNIFCLIK